MNQPVPPPWGRGAACPGLFEVPVGSSWPAVPHFPHFHDPGSVRAHEVENPQMFSILPWPRLASGNRDSPNSGMGAVGSFPTEGFHGSGRSREGCWCWDPNNGEKQLPPLTMRLGGTHGMIGAFWGQLGVASFLPKSLASQEGHGGDLCP